MYSRRRRIQQYYNNGYAFMRINEQTFYLHHKKGEEGISKCLKIYLQCFHKPITRITISRHKSLGKMPDCLFQFPYLRELRLCAICLKEIPAQVEFFTELRRLDVSHNHIKTFNGSILQLPLLQNLDLEKNKFKTLPVMELVKIRNLKLNVKQNPLSYETRGKIGYLFPDAL